jgi:hypothetical protein
MNILINVCDPYIFCCYKMSSFPPIKILNKKQHNLRSVKCSCEQRDENVFEKIVRLSIWYKDNCPKLSFGTWADAKRKSFHILLQRNFRQQYVHIIELPSLFNVLVIFGRFFFCQIFVLSFPRNGSHLHSSRIKPTEMKPERFSVSYKSDDLLIYFIERKVKSQSFKTR